MLPQYLHEAADNRIGIRNLAVVRRGGVVSLERLRRIIRVMGIVEMQPDEKRPLLVTAQPAQRAISNIFRAPLHALVPVFARLTLVKIGVINVETALEARSGRRRIENVSSKKCRCVIAVLMQEVRQVRKILAKRRTQILEMTELRIGPRQQSSVRRRSQGDLRIRS